MIWRFFEFRKCFFFKKKKINQKKKKKKKKASIYLITCLLIESIRTLQVCSVNRQQSVQKSARHEETFPRSAIGSTCKFFFIFFTKKKKTVKFPLTFDLCFPHPFQVDRVCESRCGRWLCIGWWQRGGCDHFWDSGGRRARVGRLGRHSILLVEKKKKTTGKTSLPMACGVPPWAGTMPWCVPALIRGG